MAVRIGQPFWRTNLYGGNYMDLEQLIAQTLAKVLEKKVDAVLGGKTEQEVEDTDSVEIESVDRTDLESNAKSA